MTMTITYVPIIFLGLIALAFAKEVFVSGPAANTIVAPLKWFIFREDCFEAFFDKHDFTN